jgi:alpha-1,6-mannosyltransferase
VVIAPGPRDEESEAKKEQNDVKERFLGHEFGRNVHAGSARTVRLGGPALPYDRTYHLLGRFDKVRDRVNAERADVLEAHSPYLAAAAILACGRGAARVRTAFWHADHLGTYVEPVLDRWLGGRAAGAMTAPMWRFVRGLLAPFDATFVAGHAQAARLRRAGVEGVVHVPFGVDVSLFRPAARDASVRHALLAGADAGAALFVGAGRFAFEKRWDVVLDAFARVRARRPAVLVLFGDGPERAALERTAPAGVRFLGFERERARFAAALASCDVLLHGCPYETFGLCVAEAVACGVPVVVPDAGGAADTVDRACGELYASLDAAACAAAAERLLARDPGELRARAIEAAARVPTASEHYGRVLTTYDAIFAAKAAGRTWKTPG